MITGALFSVTTPSVSAGVDIAVTLGTSTDVARYQIPQTAPNTATIANTISKIFDFIVVA